MALIANRLAFHQTRHRVWAEQPDAFFDLATIDMDGKLVGTTGSCKEAAALTG